MSTTANEPIPANDFAAELATLRARLTEKTENDAQTLEQIAVRLAKSERKLRVTWGVSTLAAVTLFTMGWHKDAIAQGYGMTLAQAATRIAALETKTASMSAITDPNTNKTTVRFSGVNVQIVDGTGKTENRDDNNNLVLSNGTGNLIIGYNELRTETNSVNTRTGSHNLVVGLQNNYSSIAGVVFGYNNSIVNRQACVLGGSSNTASGLYSSVSGGNNNTASGYASYVSGGYGNTANFDECGVFGGDRNTASGWRSCVSGGQNNTASNDRASVSGGIFNTASGFYSSVSGGSRNTASGDYSSVSGGYYVQQANFRGFSAGGQYTQASPGLGVFHSP